MATVKCIYCGAPCNETGSGKYECPFCGATFDAEQLTPKSVKNTTPVKGEGGADVFEKNINGILEISCLSRSGSWSGSGYIVSPSGYAITNAHVAADDVDGKPCSKMMVTVCGKNIPATVVSLADDKAGNGNGDDLALIKLAQMPAGAIALTFEDSTKIRNGEPVYVIGNSLGRGTCITSGIVSDKSRVIRNKPYIMTDCAVNGGNSGGPIFDEKGYVIGTINMQGRGYDGADAEGMNYAIPANIVLDFLRRNNIRPSLATEKAPSSSGIEHVVCPACGGTAVKTRYGTVCRNCGSRWN